jgi:hypothetical protein
LRWFLQGGGNTVQCAETQYTAQRACAAPIATWRNGDRTGDIVLVVIHDESQRAIEKVFD